ncbi:MAG: hypothetical protein Q4G27_02545 [Flavobacteriaceae bacterium]|nr:hypothetical protein [Flavobacteriaceae bacterium]
MITIEQIEKLKSSRQNPSVTLMLNTHRTRPDNEKDVIVLKNLISDAQKRLLDKYNKREISELLEKLDQLPEKIDHNHQLDSLHIFISENEEEMFQFPFSVHDNRVMISDHFKLNSLMRMMQYTHQYQVMILSQSGVNLFLMLNDSIEKEIMEEGFPFAENPYYVTSNTAKSDTKNVDNQIRNYFNEVDMALEKIYNRNGIKTLVITTESNYSKLLQVANRKEAYYGFSPINYNEVSPHQIAEQAWAEMQKIQEENGKIALENLNEAISQQKLLTDLQEIYRAAIDGRGDTLVLTKGFQQPVRFKDERNFELLEEDEKEGIENIDDITSLIAWEVLSKKGQVFFTNKKLSDNWGDIALKVRY